MKERKISNVVKCMLMCVIALVLTGCGKAFDFQDVTEIEFSGLDGYGKIQAVMDDSVFENKDIMKELFPDSSKKEASTELSELLAGVEYSFSKEDGLSNGDEVTVTVDYDEDIFEDNKIDAKNAEFKVKVDGLSSGTVIDVFDGLEVVYSGFSGNGNVFLNDTNCDEFVREYVYFQCDETDLTNGDTITVTANYTPETAIDNLFIVESDTKEYTVAGLKESVEIDPFENLEITYTGVSPYLTVSVDSTKCSELVNDYITFSLEDGYLRNGDIFNITASYNEYDAEQYGFTVTNSSKLYTVKNQDEYVTTLDGIDLTALQSELADKLAVVTAANVGDDEFAGIDIGYNEFVSIASSKLKSTYLISLKNVHEAEYSDGAKYNRYMEIYEYTVNREDEEPINIYVLVCADNLQKDTNGVLSWDLSLLYTAYENYDSLINDCVTAQREYYNISEIKD